MAELSSPLPGWPEELENFTIGRSGQGFRVACRHCGNRVRHYRTPVDLPIVIFVALQHWHRECPKRVAAGDVDG